MPSTYNNSLACAASLPDLYMSGQANRHPGSLNMGWFSRVIKPQLAPAVLWKAAAKESHRVEINSGSEILKGEQSSSYTRCLKCIKMGVGIFSRSTFSCTNYFHCTKAPLLEFDILHANGRESRRGQETQEKRLLWNHQ